MTKAEAKIRIVKLREQIDHYRYQYHVLDRSEISDAAQDSLKHELQELETQFPDFVTPDSPTQRVGGEPLAKFQKAPHDVPMLSLNDVFVFEEVVDWQKRVAKLLPPGTKPTYFAELKVDGLALSLTYRDGVLVRAATRGDGRIGEDVTMNTKTIEAIPLRLRKVSKALPRDIEVRGEAYMPKKVFDQLNVALQKRGEQSFANPRNAAAGAIRQLDPKVTSSRKLSFLAYDLVTDVGLSTH
ncbi:MAG: NAD-dependent DNA ligase LigA, partial [Patescibacteria group bacterium]